MATSTTVSFTPFDLDKALGGISLGFKTADDTPEFVYKFKYNSRPRYDGYYYEGVGADGTKYYFDSDGKEYGGAELYIIVSSINVTSGTAASRGDGDSEVTLDINSLQPREDFALAALIGLLQNEKDITTLDDTKITQYCNIAFKLAAGMMNTAADYRDKAGDKEEGDEGEGEEETPSATVNPNELTSNSDKLLSNISDYLKGVKENLSSDKDWSIALKGLNEKLESIIDAETKELKVKGAGGGSGLVWSSSNSESSFSNIGDIIVFNKDATPKDTRITLANFASQLGAYADFLKALASSIDSEATDLKTAIENVSLAKVSNEINGSLKSAIENIITAKVKPEALN